MARRYLVAPLPSGLHSLPAVTGHHIARVLRAQAGDTVVLFDGGGHECDARLLRVHGGRVEVDCGPPRVVSRETRVRLELACALPKGNRAEWLFEHATEVGVASFWPILCARGERADRADRWRRIAAAAAEQCDRALVPEVHEPSTIEGLLARADLPAERYVADPGAAPFAAARSEHALLLVGPPGGLARQELEALTAHGFQPRSLGPLTLRTETAALAGAVLLLQG